MASATRGKYSQKEWDAINKSKVVPVSVASKYTVPGSVESAASMVTSAQKDSSEAAYNASMIPIQLKADFKAKGDPKLDAAISEKQQQVFGGYTEGMSKYADIKDPVQRRALADKYQSGLATGLSSLTNEKERRQGQINEYITKWAGTFGAEAARKQSEVAIAQDALRMQKDIADTAESKRRWGIEQADKKLTAKPVTYNDSEIISVINEAKGAGASWEEIASRLAAKGIDVTQGSLADSELRRLHGLNPVKKYTTEE